MIRCPACGRRLSDSGPACALHGPPPPAPPPADETTPFVVPTPQLPLYRVLRTLGHGGFGAVFLAERRSDGQKVAIKVARADNVAAGDSLLRETEALSAIGPPHVPAIFEHGELEEGSRYAVLEFVQGRLLADRLSELSGPMPIEEFARLSSAILSAVEAAHSRGLVHCDLKPENIFIDDAYGAKLFDFGLVRSLDPNRARVETTKEEAPAGTPEYMSPEQCEGRLDVDGRSDLYALGLIFYEMLSGAPPFWGNSAEVQQNHRSRRPPSLSRRIAMGSALEEAIMRCLAKDPERRPQTIAELARALAAGLAAERARQAAPASSSPSSEPKPAAKPAAPGRERRAVALLFFESKSSVAAVREAMNSVGAQLAHTSGAQHVLAFGHEVGDNPTRAAAAAGEMLGVRGIAKRALVDQASVSVQVRPDGTRRYQSPIFNKKEQYPSEGDPEGVLLSPTALEVLSDVPTQPVPGRAGFAILQKAAQAAERTTTRIAVAPLVGRDDILRTLLDSARATAQLARPTIVTLLGQPGYGKTHLAQALVQHLEVIPRLQLLFARAKESLGGAAEQMIQELLRRSLGLPEASPSDLGRALLAERLGPEVATEVWAGVAVAMGWAAPEHPELRVFAAAPGALRAAAARAAGEGLRILARRQPLALVIEDAHFADETALDALEFATLAEAAAPLWVCMIGRPTFGRSRTGWATRAAERKEVTLPPLDASAAAELARRLLSPAENVPASALALLVKRTEGIPMLLVELVRGLKRDGLVRRSSKTQGWTLATDELDRLPDLPLVQWLSSRETELLPPDLLAHARLASVLGSEFSDGEVEGVLQALERAGGSSEAQLDAGIGLSRLAESGLLSRHRAGRFGFRHTLLRETLYQSVPPPEREAIHRAAYAYYERQPLMQDAERLPPMAFHASRSGLKKEAARLYLDLAGRSRARHRYLDAEMLYRNAFDNVGDDDPAGEIEARQGRAQARYRLGRHEDALNDYDDALTRARAAGRHDAAVEILLDEGVIFDTVRDRKKQEATTQEVQALIGAKPALATPVVRSRVLLARALDLHRADRQSEALDLFKETTVAARPLGEAAYEQYSHSLSLAGFVAATLGRFEEAEAAFVSCLQVFEEHGDMFGLCAALVNRCMLSMVVGNIERMLADYERALHIAREYGIPLVEAVCVQDLGEIRLILGQPEQAEPYIRRATEMYAHSVGAGTARVAGCEVQLARAKWYAGDHRAAAEIIARISAQQAEAEATGLTDALLVGSQRITLDQVALALRQAPPEDFDALIARGREFALQPQDIVEIMEWKALTAIQLGRRGEGIRLLEHAVAEAEQTARLALDRIRRRLAEAKGATDASAGARSRQSSES